ncbi:GGDEF domain-containing protein [Lignipirellula cremea]|uniref:diguanylate cyclase n=1 Tax=Lignipirellula cremea TaxID=2528010 RepID=A0A518E0X4_9BACT|nr:GGDEF domain-containing protein [Lignipirellula cremea]QDU97746.1 MraY-like glycosyltransferase [Lignipirellula cremea]
MPTELAAASLPIFALGIGLGALVVLTALMAGLWYGRRSSAPPASIEFQTEQILRMLQGVSRFTSGVAGDVSEHQEHFRRLLARLNNAEKNPGETSDEAASEVVHEILSANDALQKRLDDAETALKNQSHELAGYMTEARTDGLTELPNRRSFDDDLAARFAQWKRYRTPLSVMMVDIDHFKKFNDTHGHLAGDAVLKQVAQTLRDALRRSDVLVRFGGEEFAVILPSTTVADGGIAASHMLHAVAEKAFLYEGKVLRVTVSCGVAEAQPGDTEITLVKRADEALYAAKKAGRNCVYRHVGDRLERGDAGPTPAALTPAPLSSQKTANDFSQVCDDLRRRLLEVAGKDPQRDST